MNKETIKEFLKPNKEKLILFIILFLILSIILEISPIQFLFFGTPFWKYWFAFTHISPYYPQTMECMIPEGCGPGYKGLETIWVFSWDIFIALIIKLMLLYFISCFILTKFKHKK